MSIFEKPVNCSLILKGENMDPVEFIISAITVGATAAVQETTGKAIKEAYKGLLTLINRKFSKSPEAKAALEKYQKKPKSSSKRLQKAFQETKAAEDKDIINAAKKLNDLVSKSEAAMKNEVVIHGDAIGVIQVNTGKSTMNFDSPKKSSKPS